MQATFKKLPLLICLMSATAALRSETTLLSVQP